MELRLESTRETGERSATFASRNRAAIRHGTCFRHGGELNVVGTEQFSTERNEDIVDVAIVGFSWKKIKSIETEGYILRSNQISSLDKVECR